MYVYTQQKLLGKSIYNLYSSTIIYYEYSQQHLNHLVSISKCIASMDFFHTVVKLIKLIKLQPLKLQTKLMFSFPNFDYNYSHSHLLVIYYMLYIYYIHQLPSFTVVGVCEMLV